MSSDPPDEAASGTATGDAATSPTAPAPGSTGPAGPKIRQAVVVIHGMGEQVPLATLDRFVDAALPLENDDDPTRFLSRPEQMSDSYEARRYLAPRRAVTKEDPPEWGEVGKELYAQTEFYEYHWSHLMTGNRLGHLWPTVRRVVFTWYTNVPSGLRVVWGLVWLLTIGVAVAIHFGWFTLAPEGDLVSRFLEAVVGGGVALTVATTVVTLVQRWITTSFVDVARYLDPSPTSYAVRRSIRHGILELLRNLHHAELQDRAFDGTLHARPKYQRIVIVAHSLGAYIGYDAISRLWWELTSEHAGAALDSTPLAGDVPDGLDEVEGAAAAFGKSATDEQVMAFQQAQRQLWCGLREQGNPWRITDFVTVGTPMYMADRIAYRNVFRRRVDQLELPTCPPVTDPAPRAPRDDQRGHVYSWKTPDMQWRSLHHAAPFAAVRWTNLWYSARFGFLGDWFGGPLQPLFGAGIRDVRITGDRPSRWLPAGSHSLYFRNAAKRDDDGTTGRVLRDALDLASTAWVRPTATNPVLRRRYTD